MTFPQPRDGTVADPADEAADVHIEIDDDGLVVDGRRRRVDPGNDHVVAAIQHAAQFFAGPVDAPVLARLFSADAVVLVRVEPDGRAEVVDASARTAPPTPLRLPWWVGRAALVVAVAAMLAVAGWTIAAQLA